MPVCPICGYPELKEPPRAPSGGGSYEICPCCGFQFGVDDDDRKITETEARRQWINGGMAWYSKTRPAPKNWNPQDQLASFKPARAKKKSAKKKVSARKTVRKRSKKTD